MGDTFRTVVGFKGFVREMKKKSFISSVTGIGATESFHEEAIAEFPGAFEVLTERGHYIAWGIPYVIVWDTPDGSATLTRRRKQVEE